jgi:hypothetical protein
MNHTEGVPTARRPRIRTIVLAVGIPVVVVLGGLLLAYFWFSSNSAEAAVTPIARTLSSVGGREVCDNGDGRHTSFNDAPWYSVYYSVPDKSTALPIVLRAAAAAGSPLHGGALASGDPHTYDYDSNLPSHGYGLSLVILQDRYFDFGDCSSVPSKGIRVSGERAIFELVYYAKVD